MTAYYRPLTMTDPARPKSALTLAGGWCWFDRVERITRAGAREVIGARELPQEVATRLTAPRRPLAGLDLSSPRLMGILNVTPDSFSDGGLYRGDDGVAHALEMVTQGADILDIGGESTRPGAAEVSEADERARTEPVIAAIRASCATPISIDTRRASVARAALSAGAALVNDVSAFTHDPDMAATVAGAAACLMHAQGTPATMQIDPRYDDVVLDVYDYLEARLAACEAAGIPRERLLVDPGIGFGKTLQHNVTLLRSLSIYHGLGCGILLGASRKRFIGTLAGIEAARERMPGSVAVALWGVAQGVQVLRVHDVAETRQALSLHMALSGASGLHD